MYLLGGLCPEAGLVSGGGTIILLQGLFRLSSETSNYTMFLVYIEQEYKRGRTVFCAHIAMLPGGLAATAMVRRVLLLLLYYMTFLVI